ncbi:MAG: DNA-directed DNA polymerase II small subunit, partial [Candidatus Ranarchaeia archaeon]
MVEKLEARIENAVRKMIEAGFQISPEVIEFLKSIPTIEQFTEDAIRVLSALEDKPLIITTDILNQFVGPATPKSAEHTETPPTAPTEKLTEKRESTTKTFKPLAKEYDAEIEVTIDPTDQLSKSENKAEDFIQYFRDRFERLKSLLRHRPDISGRETLQDIQGYEANSEVVAIGMVREKHTTKTGNQLIVIEDSTSQISCIVSKKNDLAHASVNQLLIDQVIAIRGKLANPSLIYAEEILWPDIPLQKKTRRGAPELCAALLSDLHIGSKEFLEAHFQRFLLWLNGKIGDQKQRELGGRIKYIIIAGDIVDGVGVYPSQEEDLLVKDIYGQYEKAATLLQELPDYITTIIIPGNHDAVRLALPQPAIPKKFIKPVLDTGNVLSLGNPSTLKINQVNFFVFHGTSLNDIIARLPGADFAKSQYAMKELLRGRHIAPVWGATVPIAPEKRDWLVIEETPDVFHAGHIHVNALERYRG